MHRCLRLYPYLMMSKIEDCTRSVTGNAIKNLRHGVFERLNLFLVRQVCPTRILRVDWRRPLTI